MFAKTAPTARSRARRPRRRWFRWLLEDLLPRPRWTHPGLAALMLFVMVGCEEPPAKLLIKMPRDAVQSTQAIPLIPTFVQKDATMQLRASAFDARGRYMGPAEPRWSTTDPSVVTVSQSGLITILGSGQAKVRVELTTEKGDKVDAEIEVNAAIPKEVKITPPEGIEGPPYPIHLGEEQKWLAQVIDDKGNVIPDAKVFWEATNYAVTVSPDGTVEGRAIGDVKMVAEDSKSGLSAEVTMDVLDWKKEPRKKKRR